MRALVSASPAKSQISFWLVCLAVISFANTSTPATARPHTADINLSRGWNLIALPSGTQHAAIQSPLYTYPPTCICIEVI